MLLEQTRTTLGGTPYPSLRHARPEGSSRRALGTVRHPPACDRLASVPAVHRRRAWGQRGTGRFDRVRRLGAQGVQLISGSDAGVPFNPVAGYPGDRLLLVEGVGLRARIGDGSGRSSAGTPGILASLPLGKQPTCWPCRGIRCMTCVPSGTATGDGAWTRGGVHTRGHAGRFRRRASVVTEIVTPSPHRLAPWWDRPRTRTRERHGYSRDGRAARTPNQSMCTTSEALVG